MTKSHYSYWLDFILGWKFEHSHGMYIFWMDNEIHLQFIEYFLFSFYYKHSGLSYVCLKWLVPKQNYLANSETSMDCILGKFVLLGV